MGNCAHTENAKSKKIVDDHRLLDFEDLTAFLELFDGLRLALAVSSRPDCPPTHVLSVQHLVAAVAPTGTRTIGNSVRGPGPQNEVAQIR